jgi:hypothetical protein
MKVKMLYSTELEDLPSEVGNLLGRTANDLRHVAVRLDRAVEDLEGLDFQLDGNEERVSQKIINLGELANKTLNVVARIDDCLGILSGLQKLLEDIRTQRIDQQNSEKKESKETLSDS